MVNKKYKPISRKMLKDYIKMRDLKRPKNICDGCYYSTIKLILDGQ
jgi:hypothetical protein